MDRDQNRGNGEKANRKKIYKAREEMEALEEDYGDGNGKNESRQFIEGLMDLE